MRVMTFCKRTFLPVIVLMIMMIASSCANGSNAPTADQDVPALSPPSNENYVVKTTNATVDGKSYTILTDKDGYTLYYFTDDKLHNVACTTGCIDTWPPLLYDETGAVSASGDLPGELTTDKTANGNQVVYNGYYLYKYTSDSAPGDTKGHGVGKKWYVATTDLKKNEPVQSGGS